MIKKVLFTTITATACISMPFLYAMESVSAVQKETVEHNSQEIINLQQLVSLPPEIQCKLASSIMKDHIVVPLIMKHLFVNPVDQLPCISAYCIDEQERWIASSQRFTDMSGVSESIWIEDLTGQEVSSLFVVNNNNICCLAFNKKGTQLLCGLDDGAILFLDPRTMESGKKIQTQMLIDQIAILDDGKQAIISGQERGGRQDALARIIDLNDGNIKKEWRADSTCALFSIAVSKSLFLVQEKEYDPKSSLFHKIATKIVNSASMNLQKEYPDDLVIIPHNSDIRIAYSCKDDSVKVYNKQGILTKKFSIDATVNAIAATPELLITTKNTQNNRHAIALWDLHTGFKLREWFARGQEATISLTANNNYLCVFTASGTVRLRLYNLKAFTDEFKYLKRYIDIKQALFLHTLYPHFEPSKELFPLLKSSYRSKKYIVMEDSEEKEVIDSFDNRIKSIVSMAIKIKKEK